ncbi:MAG: TIGR04372 family glycosyltransferase [Pseudomonadota bacterium]
MKKQSVKEQILWAAYFLPALLLRALNFRVPDFFITRIGHLLLEPDCLIKEEHLGLVPKRNYIMLASSRRVANRAVLRYWQRYFWVISSPVLVKLMRPLMTHPLTKLDVASYAATSDSSAGFARIQALWSKRDALLSLDLVDRQRGDRALRELGVPEGAWFICVHSREGSYSAYDEHNHNFRNSNIEDYVLAVQHIVSLGGWCIRLGDSSMRPAPAVPGLIDYAHHPLRSDWLDLYLGANARFFLGNSSGALSLSAIFGIPVACANMAPLAAVFPFGERDIGIPKLYSRASSGELIPFDEILSTSMADFRHAKDFKSAGIALIDNSPEEIRDLAMEQYQNTGDVSTPPYTPDDEALQRTFQSLFRPGHYTYHSSSRIGRSFLSRYQHLLPR